ncbi:MAG: OmpA family protein [Bdellovibrionales bacterium]|nr:OmpA family protein [Bdellovibrionales bacterium]
MGWLDRKKQPEVVEQSRHPEIDPYLHAAGHDESNWLMSYADIMTLLCGFFIMLFSFAKLDATKYEKVRESVAKQFGGDFKSANAEYARFLHQVIEKNGLEKEAAVRFGADGVSLVFQSTTFFDTLSSEISPEGAKTLEPFFAEISRIQTAEHKQFKVAVEGHTDSRKILSGPYPSNWELSSARAARVVRAFIDHGFDPKRLVAIGYADTRPEVEPARDPAAVDETTANDRNRRVVIRIFDETAGPAGPSATALPPSVESPTGT